MNNNITKWLEVYPNINECVIQTFNDKDKEEKSQSRILPMTKENLEKCEILQTKLPYGIYFSVNPMQNGKRNRESVKKIQTWICDIDDMDKEKQLELIQKAPLKPSLVVESVHWFHLYYLADKWLSEEEYENGNWWLKNYYNWDSKVCKDTARVLRIPWFYHMKWEPILEVFREDLSCYELYWVEEMLNAFPNQTDTTTWRVNQRIKLNTYLNESDNFWTKASELDSRMMLEEFSWTSWLSWDIISFKKNTWWTEQIYVNWKSTGCWIDRNGLIWSWDKGWPTWIQWLKRYGLVDRKELAKELKSRHPELEEKKITRIDTEKMIYNPSDIPQLQKPEFTWWDKGIDDNIWKMKRGQLIILAWETWAGKTTFATFMARYNPKSCYYVLEDKVENIASRYAIKRAWITKSELNEWTWWDAKQKLYEQAYRSFRKDLTMVDVGQKTDIEALLLSMKEMKDKWYWMFFIDNLGFVIWKWKDETEQTADISAKLVSFCLNEDVCIVLLHHFKKWAKDERDISQLRGSGKVWDDAFTVVTYKRDYDNTYLSVYKDRTWWDLQMYEIIYDRWDFKFLQTVI